MTNRTPKEIIENSVFYGCNDESYELFRATCELAYLFNGFDDTRAKLLAEWAEDMAVDSKEWALSNYGDLEETDSERGYWG